jgi:hypothetical protein
MIHSEQRMINKKNDELFDELETMIAVLIGQYRKRM